MKPTNQRVVKRHGITRGDVGRYVAAVAGLAVLALGLWQLKRSVPSLAPPATTEIRISPEVDQFDGFGGGVIDGCRYYVAAKREPLSREWAPKLTDPEPVEITAWVQLDCGIGRKVMCRASTASGGNGYCRSGEP